MTESKPSRSGVAVPDEPSSSTTLFELLANTRRRFALHYLCRQPGSVELDDLAAQVVQWERDQFGSDEDAIADHRTRATIQLRHVHLPKLADADVVRYEDDEHRLVSLRDRTPFLESYLAQAAETDFTNE